MNLCYVYTQHPVSRQKNPTPTIFSDSLLFLSRRVNYHVHQKNDTRPHRILIFMFTRKKRGALSSFQAFHSTNTVQSPSPPNTTRKTELNSVFSSPLSSGSLISCTIGLVHMSDLGHKWIIGVRIGKHRAD